MTKTVTTRKTTSFTEQLNNWITRWNTAKDRTPDEQEAVRWFARATESNWAAERKYAQDLAKVVRILGGTGTIDVRIEGRIDTPQEFAAAMVQVMKRLTPDQVVELGQNPTANMVLHANQDAVAPVEAEATPGFLRNETEEKLASEKDAVKLERILTLQAEGASLGYSGNSLYWYVNAMSKQDEGDPETAMQYMQLAVQARDENESMPRRWYTTENQDDQ